MERVFLKADSDTKSGRGQVRRRDESNGFPETAFLRSSVKTFFPKKPRVDSRIWTAVAPSSQSFLPYMTSSRDGNVKDAR